MKKFSSEEANSIEQNILHELKSVIQEYRVVWVNQMVNLLRNTSEVKTILQSKGLQNDLNESRKEHSDGESAHSGIVFSVASLSQLRKEVGGRFENLKARWKGCGFPLKQHRGSTKESYTLNQEGWLEMTTWLEKQGYSAELLGDDAIGYFEITKQ